MKISFCCQSCQASLKVDASFAGRAIRCPRCGQTTQIPENASPGSDPAENAAVPTPSSTNANGDLRFAEICAFFESNPFAFSFALDAETPPELKRRFSVSNDSQISAASNAPQTFYRDEFLSKRRSGVESDAPAASQSPSVNEMIAGLLEENNQ